MTELIGASPVMTNSSVPIIGEDVWYNLWRGTANSRNTQKFKIIRNNVIQRQIVY